MEYSYIKMPELSKRLSMLQDQLLAAARNGTNPPADLRKQEASLKIQIGLIKDVISPGE